MEAESVFGEPSAPHSVCAVAVEDKRKGYSRMCFCM